VATGSTTAGAALHPGVRRIDAVELSATVLDLAREFFEPFNRRVFDDPRVRLIATDARRVMARERGVYDVVIGDLFLPWRTGEGRLYTLEHFRNARTSLKPGGMFCQWLPMYQLTRSQYESIRRTFTTVFPEAFLIRGDFFAERPILGLVGGRPLETLSWSAIEAACDALRGARNTTDPLARHAEGVAMLVVGPLMQPEGEPLITLANAWIEWDAGRNIIGLGEPWFVGVPLADQLRAIHCAGVGHLPAPVRPWHDAGQFFVTLEIAARMRQGTLEALEAQVPQRLPPALARDEEASWLAWPMSVKPKSKSQALSP
jgi:spermidine synthase